MLMMMMVVAEDLKGLFMILVLAQPHRDQYPGGSTPGRAKEKENTRVKEGVEREKRGVDKRWVFMPRDANSSSGQEN